jgi:hypothetical protein
MKLKRKGRRNASDLVLVLMISALLTVLITRFFLQLFGWPTISFGVWHIAHVLWGGLLMVLGAIFLLTNYGKRNRRISAIFIGIGWGLFIDEIGKYLTKNNNYWFQPAIIFIYISFICLFLIYRYLDKQKNKSKNYLGSIVDQLEELMENKSEKEQKELAFKIKKILGKKKKSKPETFWKKMLAKTGYYSYNKIFKRKFTLIVLGAFAGVWAIERIREIWQILTNPQRIETIKSVYYNYEFLTKTDLYMIILKIVFDAVVALLFLLGLSRLVAKRKISGLNFFQWGLIINIFLSSVIKFYFEQFDELIVLGLSILLLVAISRLKKELYT